MAIEIRRRAGGRGGRLRDRGWSHPADKASIAAFTYQGVRMRGIPMLLEDQIVIVEGTAAMAVLYLSRTHQRRSFTSSTVPPPTSLLLAAAHFCSRICSGSRHIGQAGPSGLRCPRCGRAAYPAFGPVDEFARSFRAVHGRGYRSLDAVDPRGAEPSEYRSGRDAGFVCPRLGGPTTVYESQTNGSCGGCGVRR